MQEISNKKVLLQAPPRIELPGRVVQPVRYGLRHGGAQYGTEAGQYGTTDGTGRVMPKSMRYSAKHICCFSVLWARDPEGFRLLIQVVEAVL